MFLTRLANNLNYTTFLLMISRHNDLQFEILRN